MQAGGEPGPPSITNLTGASSYSAFRNPEGSGYIPGILRESLEIPKAAKAYVRDMKAFFKSVGHAADAIAAKQAWLLKQHLRHGPRFGSPT